MLATPQQHFQQNTKRSPSYIKNCFTQLDVRFFLFWLFSIRDDSGLSNVLLLVSWTGMIISWSAVFSSQSWREEVFGAWNNINQWHSGSGILNKSMAWVHPRLWLTMNQTEMDTIESTCISWIAHSNICWRQFTKTRQIIHLSPPLLLQFPLLQYFTNFVPWNMNYKISCIPITTSCIAYSFMMYQFWNLI